MYIMDTLADSSYTRRVVIVDYSIHYYYLDDYNSADCCRV